MFTFKLYNPILDPATGNYSIIYKPGITPKLPDQGLILLEPGIEVSDPQSIKADRKAAIAYTITSLKALFNGNESKPFRLQDITDCESQIKDMLKMGLKYKVFTHQAIEAAIQTLLNLHALMASPEHAEKTRILLENPEVNFYHLFVISFLESEKLLEDKPFDNYTWSELSKIALPTINRLESEYLDYTGIFARSFVGPQPESMSLPMFTATQPRFFTYKLYKPVFNGNNSNCMLTYIPGVTRNPEEQYKVELGSPVVDDWNLEDGHRDDELIEYTIKCVSTIRQAYPPISSFLAIADTYDNDPISDYENLLETGLTQGVFSSVDIENALQHFLNLSALLACPDRAAASNKLAENPNTTCYTLFAVAFMVSQKIKNRGVIDYGTWSTISNIGVSDLQSLEKSYKTYVERFNLNPPAPTAATVIVAGPSSQRNQGGVSNQSNPVSNENNPGGHNLPDGFKG